MYAIAAGGIIFSFVLVKALYYLAPLKRIVSVLVSKYLIYPIFPWSFSVHRSLDSCWCFDSRSVPGYESILLIFLAPPQILMLAIERENYRLLT